MNIVERLRNFSLARSGELHRNPDAAMADEAADEIEHLEADTTVKARLLNNQRDEIKRLRGHLKRHFAFARFVHLWTNRDNVTDAERASVIKNHPDLKRWVEGEDAVEQSAQTPK